MPPLPRDPLLAQRVSLFCFEQLRQFSEIVRRTCQPIEFCDDDGIQAPSWAKSRMRFIPGRSRFLALSPASMMISASSVPWPGALDGRQLCVVTFTKVSIWLVLAGTSGTTELLVRSR